MPRSPHLARTRPAGLALVAAASVALLVGCALEAFHRPFLPALGWPMLALVVAAQALRWWCITTLGPQWNTRVIVVPGAALVERGPYRYLKHPNYVAVVLEFIAIPMMFGAWRTAIATSVANLVLLTIRIRAEERALASAAAAAAGTPG